MPSFLFLFPLFSFLGGLFCLFGIRKTEEIYIRILLKVFEYAATLIRHEETTRKKEAHDKQNLLRRRISRANDYSLIKNEVQLSDEETEPNHEKRNHLADPIYFTMNGVAAIIDDDVTKRFSAEQLEVWNLLSRTHQYTYINWKLSLIVFFGIFVRYFILLPFRLIIFVTSILTLTTMSVLMGYIPNDKVRRVLNRYTTLVSFRLFIRSFSGVINFHNSQFKAKSDGICVANHTSPIDVIILGCDNVYAMVGQKQGGFMGLVQKAFSCAEAHIWFDRSEMRDRQAVAQRMREHVQNPDKLPILIFPEGTCINNTSVMMFKKGSFEVGGVIYPVAIKYDMRFADCFWNSGKYSLLRYLMMMMTSWAIKADVWYLPPETQQPGENSIQFTNRVRNKIAMQGGLVELDWDGMLKRSKPKEELKWAQQKSYSDKILKGE